MRAFLISAWTTSLVWSCWICVAAAMRQPAIDLRIPIGRQAILSGTNEAGTVDQLLRGVSGTLFNSVVVNYFL